MSVSGVSRATKASPFPAIAKASLPADHLFQMKANGQVLNGSDGLITTLVSGAQGSDPYCGWKYTNGPPASWKLDSGTFCDGTFYFEGSAEVSGNPGPWKTTLIATGDIVISGTPTIQTDNTHNNTSCGTNCYTVLDTVFVAGYDVKITGNATAGNGLIAAHEQVGITGNAIITGFIVAEDASSTHSTVGSDTETGNLTITYDCYGSPPLQVPLHFLSWGL